MSYSLSLRELAELLDDPDACGENLDPWEAGSSRLEIAVVEALPSILMLIDELGFGLDWALTYTNARVAEESPASNNPLHKRALGNAIIALNNWERAKEK